MKQSQRIYSENLEKEIDREKLLEMKAEDFEVNVAEQFSDKKSSIGFKM